MHKRKAIASIVIIAGAGFCLWSFLSSRALEGSPGDVRVRESATPASPSLRFTAGPISLPSGIGAVLGETTNAGSPNMTDLLIDSYLSTVVGQNPSGPTDGKVSLPDSDMVTSLVEAGSQQGISFSRFTERDVRVSPDSSSVAQRQYIESLDTALTARFTPVRKTIFDALDEMNETGDTVVLERIIGAVSGYIGDVLALRVPSPLLIAHLDWLNHWQEKLETYRAIAQVSDDPLKAYVALKQISTLVESGNRLQAVLTSMYEDLKS